MIFNLFSLFLPSGCQCQEHETRSHSAHLWRVDEPAPLPLGWNASGAPRTLYAHHGKVTWKGKAAAGTFSHSLSLYLSRCTCGRCRELKLVERCLQLPSRAATKAEILQLHSAEHYECLERTAGVKDEESMEELSSHYDAIYIHPVRQQGNLSHCCCHWSTAIIKLFIVYIFACIYVCMCSECCDKNWLSCNRNQAQRSVVRLYQVDSATSG